MLLAHTNAYYTFVEVWLKWSFTLKVFFTLVVLQCNNNWFKFQHMLCICPRINDHHYYTHQSNGWSVLRCMCVVYFTALLAAPRAVLFIILVSWSRIYMYLLLSLCADHARALLLNFSYAISNYTRGENVYICRGP